MSGLVRKVFFFFAAFTLTSPLFALEVPARPDGYVTDKAGMLSAEARSKLEFVLRSYEAQTTNQVVVATFPSLEGDSLEDFSIRLAEAWKVGQKDKDNGVIFLIFKDDRKMRIEVGYGLEGALPDALAGQIITAIQPDFRQGHYEQGILKGVALIIQATKGEFKLAAPQQTANGYQRELTPEEMKALKKEGEAFLLFVLIAVAVLFVIDLFRYRGYLRDHRVYNYRYSFWEWFFRFAILLAVISIIFRMLFYAALFSRGGYGGGRGSGGFSGGGGSFGGGGASGGW